MPTARQLETFISVARHGSVRAAADNMGVSQPTVSKQLIALERKLGLTLFDRHRGSTARLTDDGRRLLQQAEDTLAGQLRLGRKVRTGRLPSVVTVLIRHHLFTEIEPWIDDLKLPNGVTELRFEIVGNSTDYKERVMRDRDTVAIMRTIAAMSAGTPDYFVLAINTCSLFASSNCQNPYALPILMPEWGALTDLQKAHLRAAGIAEDRFQTDSPYTASILRHVVDGMGAAVFMDTHVENYLAAGKLVRLDYNLASLYLQFVSHPAMQPTLRKLVRDKFHLEILPRAK